MAMADSVPAAVLEALGVPAATLRVLKDVPGENGSWLAERPGGAGRAVLRRYHPGATRTDLGYEHAVLAHLAGAGWVVPRPLSELIEDGGFLFCLTRYVPGAPVTSENAAQQRRRGNNLARLHLALRELGDRIGQRPGWRPQHRSVVTNGGVDWHAGVRGLTEVSARLGDWASAAADQTRRGLAAVGAAGLPVMVVHGDFAPWNVHYERGRLAGVIDFGLTHADSRPYELAIARTYRAPEVLASYRARLARAGWPLSALEEAAIGPVYRAFRVGMLGWVLQRGAMTGRYDLVAIERALARTGTVPP